MQHLRRVVKTPAVVVMLAAFVVAAANAATTPGGSMRMTVTGEIRQVDPGTIVVGHAKCVVPRTLTANVGRFVVGDPVRITCLGKTLSGVKYSPEIAPNQSSKAGSTPPSISPTPSPPAPACGLACAKSITYSVGTLFNGGGPTGDPTSTTGAISDISDGSVTAGGLTCSFRSSFDALFNQVARVGDNVTLTCVGGTFVGMKSVGSVAR